MLWVWLGAIVTYCNLIHTSQFQWYHSIIIHTPLNPCRSRAFQAETENLLCGFFVVQKTWANGAYAIPPTSRGRGYVISLGTAATYGGATITLPWESSWNSHALIPREHDVRFNMGQESRGCNNTYIVTSSESTLSMAEKSDDSRHLCVEEYRAHPSYMYNCAS